MLRRRLRDVKYLPLGLQSHRAGSHGSVGESWISCSSVLTEINHNDISVGIIGKIFQLKQEQGLPCSYHYTYNLQSQMMLAGATVGERHIRWARDLLLRRRAELLGGDWVQAASSQVARGGTGRGGGNGVVLCIRSDPFLSSSLLISGHCLRSWSFH